MRGIENTCGGGCAVTGFDNSEFATAISAKPFQVFIHRRFGIMKRWLTCHNDTKSHALTLAQTGFTIQLL
jgi:hypothetical protein